MAKYYEFECKTCGHKIYFDYTDGDDIFYDSDEALWGHIQREHPDLFREWCDFDTPDMRETLYEGPKVVEIDSTKPQVNGAI